MEEWTQVPSHPGPIAAAAEEPPSSGLLCPDQFLHAFENFKKSGAPSRFLLFSEEAWRDLRSEVFEELKAGFVAGKSTLEVPMDGKWYLFDFLSMSRIDPATGGQNRIGWIDVDGQCFFPRYAMGENVKRSPGVDKSVSIPTISLKKDILSLIKAFDPSAFITSISSCIQESKRSAYLRLCKKTPGKPRLCAWYGSSSSNIHNVLSHGFGQCNMGMKGLPFHGYGINLSPQIYASAMQSEPDDNGERHMIFCVAIVGNCEKVERGSTQGHPSNECYDSGTDDLVNPKWYVIWSTNMNTHILTVYIVSFKTPGLSQGDSDPSPLPQVRRFLEVDNIIAKETSVDGSSKYLVHRKDQPISEDTWMPKSDLDKFGYDPLEEDHPHLNSSEKSSSQPMRVDAAHQQGPLTRARAKHILTRLEELE